MPRPGRVRGYLKRVLVACDQLANAVLGGFPNETVSCRLGKRKLARGGALTWRDWGGIAKPLDRVLELIEFNHSILATQQGKGDATAEEVRSSCGDQG